MPFSILNAWLDKETELGSPNPNRMVLATATQHAVPHSRVVAIKEITAQSILFFTQHGTRKTLEMQENPLASATIWLPMQQRQIIFDGKIVELSQDQNDQYWRALPRETQLKFSAYSPTSGQPIQSIATLEKIYSQLAKKFADTEIPLSEFYRGYRLVPEKILFYTLGVETFSEVFEFQLNAGGWQQQIISP